MLSKRKRTTIVLTSGLLVAVISAGALWAAASKKLVFNGKVASTRVQTLNGQAVVPLADVAKALGMVVVKTPGGYEIKKPGGATPVQGLNGKIGDVLFDGKWRLQVQSLQTGDSYTMKTDAEPSSTLYASSEWNRDTRTLSAKSGFTLVVLQLRVTNGQKTPQNLWTAPSDTNLRTAIADYNGESHPPIAYDYAGGPIQTPVMLPGAIKTFNVVFGVPSSARLKDLVFTLKNNDYAAKGNDVRVSLGEASNASGGRVER